MAHFQTPSLFIFAVITHILRQTIKNSAYSLSSKFVEKRFILYLNIFFSI